MNPLAHLCFIYSLSLSVIFYFSAPVRPKKMVKKYIHPLSDEVYDTLLLMLQGKFHVPVVERSREQKNAVVRFWRNRDRFHLGPETTPTLYFDGRKVVKTSSISVIVGKTFEQVKSGGCRKLRNRASTEFAGLSERRILQVTSSEVKYRIRKAKFTNKATREQVLAENVHSQHHVDLMDMFNGAIHHNGRIYRYVLSVMDIFSRFLWLRPLQRKSSRHVSRCLTSIYNEHGPPDRLKTEAGSRFEGKLKSVCEKWKIELGKSRTHRPPLVGMVERSYGRLREKIMRDLMVLSKKGVNWVVHLPDYNRIVNEESKKELGWKSPFEIYYGRKSNVIVKTAVDTDESDDALLAINPPHRCDLDGYFNGGNRVYTITRNERPVTLHKQGEYCKGEEEVLSIIRSDPDRTGGVPPKKRFVPTNFDKETEKWTSAEDIKSLRSKRFVPNHPINDREFSDMDSVFVLYNPPGNGNCQFEALSFWLNRGGIHRSAQSIRGEIVTYLEHHSVNIEGVPLELFAGMPWSKYLQAMANDGTYGDQLTLQAAADIYSLEIIVFSSLGVDATTVISPSLSDATTTVQLGHYAEQHGEHYVCVDAGMPSEDQLRDVDKKRNRSCEGVDSATPPGEETWNVELEPKIFC